ncbi:hypothetical protein QAD02_019692, partial [Eretmocerus hayati]
MSERYDLQLISLNFCRNGDPPVTDVCVPQIISQLYYGRVILEKLPKATLDSLNQRRSRDMGFLHRNSDYAIKVENPCSSCAEIVKIWKAHKQNNSYQHRVKQEFDSNGLKQEVDHYAENYISRDYLTGWDSRGIGESEDEADDSDNDYGLFPIKDFDSVSGLAVLTKKYCPTCDDIIDWYISSSDEICPMCDSAIRLQCSDCSQDYSDNSTVKSHSTSWCVSGKSIKKSKRGNRISNKPVLTERARPNNSDHIAPTECPKCNKVLKNLSSFRRHSRICKELFRCDYCSFESFHGPSLKRHIKRNHSIDQQYYESADNTLGIFKGKESKSRKKGQDVQRFCLACQHLSKKFRRKCDRCGNKSLVTRCAECNFFSDRYSVMYYHIKHQCQSPYQSKSVKKAEKINKLNGVGKESTAISKKHTSNASRHFN